MRRRRSSATLTCRTGGRAGLAVLALLALLGLLAMHGTPMPAMAAMAGTGVLPAGHGLSGHIMSEPSASDPYVVGDGADGDRHPSPQHMTAPCVSDGARSHAHSLAPAQAPVTAVAVARRLEGTAALPGARADRSPPDLSELCISRT